MKKLKLNDTSYLMGIVALVAAASLIITAPVLQAGTQPTSADLPGQYTPTKSVDTSSTSTEGEDEDGEEESLDQSSSRSRAGLHADPYDFPNRGGHIITTKTGSDLQRSLDALVKQDQLKWAKMTPEQRAKALAKLEKKRQKEAEKRKKREEK